MKIETAADWLDSFLAKRHDNEDRETIIKEANQAGYSESQIVRAKRLLGVSHQRIGNRGLTVWERKRG